MRCPLKLEQNTFVCEYVGEIFDNKVTALFHSIVSKFDVKLILLQNEGAARENKYQCEGRGQYIVVDRRDSSFGIDATLRGNVARFFNHSCEPNMFKVFFNALFFFIASLFLSRCMALGISGPYSR